MQSLKRKTRKTTESELAEDHERRDESPEREPVEDAVEEIAERIVNAYFATPSVPAEDEPEMDREETPQIIEGGGVIYTAGFNRASRLISGIPAPQQSEARAKQSPELLLRKAEVRLLAEQVLGGRPAAIRWMEKPLIFHFSGRRPAEVMATLEGCDEVEAFLRLL